MNKKDNQRPEQSPWVLVARYSEIGFIIPAAVLLGFLIGKLLDHWLHTQWLFIAGVLVGAAIGFIEMIRKASGSTKHEE